jgi:hypothetical protein
MSDRWTKAFWIALALSTLGRAAFALLLPLTGDEAYLWEWARHPALSYYDHPGLSGWLLWLSTAVFGDTVFGVRFPALAALTLCLVLLHRLALALSGSPRTAAQAGLLAMGMPLLMAGGVLMTTDAALLVTGPLGALFFLRALSADRTRDWLGLGACFALSFLAKFLGLFLPLACFAHLALAPEARPFLKRRGPWLALALLLLGALPVLGWNATHGWATFLFNLSARQEPLALSLTTLADYLAGQALALSPLVFLFAFPALGAALRRLARRSPQGEGGSPQGEGGSPQGEGGSIPALFAFIPYGGFLAGSLVKKVGVHWPGMGAPFLGLAVAMHLLREGKEKAYRAALAVAWGVTGLLLLAGLLILLLPGTLPAGWKYPLRPEKINAATIAKIRLDPGMGRAVREALDRLAAEGGGTFLFTRSYALSPVVAFYTPGRPEVTVLGAGSAHGQNYRFWFDPAAHRGENALFISEKGLEREAGFLAARFARWEAAPSPEGGGAGSLTLIRCFGFSGEW